MAPVGARRAAVRRACGTCGPPGRACGAAQARQASHSAQLQGCSMRRGRQQGGWGYNNVERDAEQPRRLSQHGRRRHSTPAMALPAGLLRPTARYRAACAPTNLFRRLRRPGANAKSEGKGASSGGSAEELARSGCVTSASQGWRGAAWRPGCGRPGLPAVTPPVCRRSAAGCSTTQGRTYCVFG